MESVLARPSHKIVVEYQISIASLFAEYQILIASLEYQLHLLPRQSHIHLHCTSPYNQQLDGRNVEIQMETWNHAPSTKQCSAYTGSQHLNLEHFTNKASLSRSASPTHILQFAASFRYPFFFSSTSVVVLACTSCLWSLLSNWLLIASQISPWPLIFPLQPSLSIKRIDCLSKSPPPLVYY